MPPPISSSLKTRRVLACETCRARRTRCDGVRPMCGSCQTRRLHCQYPRPVGNRSLDVEGELSQIRLLLDRIDRAVRSTPDGQGLSHEHGRVGLQIAHEAIPPALASPSQLPWDFPYMQLQAGAFTKMAGLGDDYGNRVVQLERDNPVDINSTSIFMLQQQNVIAALQAFSEKIHPWYPILESAFSRCVSDCLASSFKHNTDSFLVLMVLASGSIAREESHSRALQQRPDLMYLDAALKMMQWVVLGKDIRSIQCLAAASIHYYLLFRPLQAHDFAVLAVKKAQDLHLSSALHGSPEKLELWTRLYRVVLLIEGELVVPIKLAESNAWEWEEDIPLPAGTDIWCFDGEGTSLEADTPASMVSTQSSDQLATYLLAEVAMRRMLRRNTAAIRVSSDGNVEYAPVIARELEAQLQHWYSFLPETFRFSRNSASPVFGNSFQTTFLCAQYWAYLVSVTWPSVVKVMESDILVNQMVEECKRYFHAYVEFIKSATAALSICRPNKWTIYASIFAISVGAYMGASNSLLEPLTTQRTRTALRNARDCFGDECNYSPSLLLMRQSINDTFRETAEV